MENPLYLRERLVMLGFVLAAWLGIFLLSQFSHIAVDYTSFSILYLSAGVCIGFSVLMMLVRHQHLAPAFETMAAGLLLVVPILVSTFLAMGLGYPLADAELIAMDRALGFNWIEFVQFVDQFAFLSKSLEYAYTSFALQSLVVPILLVAGHNTPRACAFVVAFGILCFLSSYISIWYPAISAYPVFEVAKDELSNINAHFGYFFLDDFNAVRSGSEFIVNSKTASGIITYPSVHAGVAYLIIWAMWDNRWARWPFAVGNVLMAISAITHGSHYFVDIVASLGTAGLSIFAVSHLMLNKRFRINQSPQPAAVMQLSESARD